MIDNGIFHHSASSRKTIREDKSERLNASMIAVIRLSVEPLSAEDILFHLQEQKIPISITTVYNRLRQLVTKGSVTKHKSSGGSYTYTTGETEIDRD